VAGLNSIVNTYFGTSYESNVYTFLHGVTLNGAAIFNNTATFNDGIAGQLTGVGSNYILQLYSPLLSTGNATGIIVGMAGNAFNSAVFQFGNAGGAGSSSNEADIGVLGEPLVRIFSNGSVILPSGASLYLGTNVVLPSTLTGYNGNASGVKVPLALAWSTPSSLTAVCHDENGNLTDASCPGGTATSITVGTTTVVGGTTGYLLYDNSGTLGDLATTGSGSVVLATLPTLPQGYIAGGTASLSISGIGWSVTSVVGGATAGGFSLNWSGSGSATSTLTITLPTAPHGWACSIMPLQTGDITEGQETAYTTASAAITFAEDTSSFSLGVLYSCTGF
jgi:hypothetical protein